MILNKKIINYWIAATGRNNWTSLFGTPFSNPQICSLHFTNNDYMEHNKSLKPNAIPTQYVQSSILEVFQQDTEQKIKEYNQNNNILEEQKLTNKQNDNHVTAAASKYCKCENYNRLSIENEELRMELEFVKVAQISLLNRQANMFHTIMHNKEAVLKKKLEMVKNKNIRLIRSIQQKGKNITNLRTLLKDLKRKNILEGA